MGTRIPNAETDLIPGAGHAANLDTPEAVDAAVLGFLERLG